MKVHQLLYVSSMLMAVLAIYVAADEEKKDKKKKLQIGVKKRVDPENCPIKSKKGDTLHMHYTVGFSWNLLWIIDIFYFKNDLLQGKLEDGTEFDSSIPRGQPFTFSLGAGQVIKGWDQGLLGYVMAWLIRKKM